MYGTGMSQLVQEVFLDNGDVAEREEKFWDFLAGLALVLKAKCPE